MPIYAYRCAACGHAKDVLQKLSDPLLSVCPACGAEAFRKQLTAAGFQLKGSGWYVTDFKGGSAPAAAGDGKDGKEGKDSKDGKDGKDGKAPASDQPAAVPAPAAAPAPAASSAPAPAPAGPASTTP